MSTGVIIAIVVVVLLLLALLLFVLPRARARSRERELERRRGEAAEAHRDRAETRSVRAQEAEQIAARERAEADLHETRASMHERGLADDDLERDREGLGVDDDAGGRTAAPRSDEDPGDFERGREVGRQEAGDDEARFDREAGAQRDDRL